MEKFIRPTDAEMELLKELLSLANCARRDRRKAELIIEMLSERWGIKADLAAMAKIAEETFNRSDRKQAEKANLS